MGQDFLTDFLSFLSSLQLKYRLERDYRIVFQDQRVVIIPMPLVFFRAEDEFKRYVSDFATNERKHFEGYQVIFLYEDRWFNAKRVLMARIKAHLGMDKVIFARSCECREIERVQERGFLSKYHSYGWAKSRFAYGLFYKDVLVAVASFSAPREMERQGLIVESYEWVRYASLPDFRIVGGMGKLMNFFIERVSPQEIMSYADKEWSIGETYLKLGFIIAGEKDPMPFYVDKNTMERISVRKTLRDKRYTSLESLTVEDPENQFSTIYNMGSIKYLLPLYTT